MSGRLTGCVSSPWMVPTSTALATRRSQPGRKVNGSRRVKRSRIAGSSVIASTAAIAIEKFLVKASGLKSRPSCASSAKMGRNETAITSSEKKLGPPTSFTAAMTTSRKSPGRPSACQRSSFLCVCSTTTMAASTMAPIATAMPPSDMMLAVSPSARMGMKASSTAIGMVKIGMSALGRCQRKRRMTPLTMRSSSTSVWRRVSMARSMSVERS